MYGKIQIYTDYICNFVLFSDWLRGGSTITKPASENSNAEAPAQQAEPATAVGKLNLQVIDGYLAQIETCIVKDDDPAMPCDDNFKNADTGKYTFTTDASGKVNINLTSKQVAQLKEKGYVKFKAVAPHGSRDIVFGNETKTTQDLVLVGTKFFDSEKFDKQVADDNTDVFILTPFTTLTEMLLKGDEKITEEKYRETLNKIAESLGVDPDVITTDYNDKSNEKSRAAILAGEVVVKLNYLPRTDDDLAAVSIMDLDSMTAKLESDVKPLVDELKQENISDYDELVAKIEARRQLMSKSYVSASTGIAEDWRCATNKLNEVVCWGNNAWNNLGNQEFTDQKLKTGKYSEGHENDLMYLKDNYTSEPVNVLVKNPYKSLADDPDYVKLSGVTKVMTGNAHGCAITIDGEVYCWGSNSSGQLGLGSDEYKTENMNVGYASKVVTGEQGAKSGHLGRVVDLSLGVDHSCALTVEGDIYCWGDNTAMELGDAFEKQSVRPIFTVEDCNGDITDKIKIVTDPVKVPAGDVKFSSISKTGSWAHCALSTEETTDDEGHNLWCWGNDVGGLVTSNNRMLYGASVKEYVDDNNQIYIDGTCYDFNDPYAPGALLPTRYWFYSDTSYEGRKWPMFGKKLTNVKSILSHDTWQLCEGGECRDVLCLDYNGVPAYYDNDYIPLQSGQKCVNRGEEIKHVTAMDITGDIANSDSAFYFVTTDDNNKLFLAGTDNSNEQKDEYSIASYVYPQWSVLTDSKKITGIVTNPHGIVFVLTDENKMYGVGLGRYGMLDNNNQEIVFDGVAPSIKAVSAIQRSACALVSETASEDSSNTLWCWGSNTFGQTGMEYKTLFSFGESQEAWQGYGGNEFFDNPDSYDQTPKKVNSQMD